MSYSTFTTHELECDEFGCSEHFKVGPGGSVRELRREAKRRGWRTYVSGTGFLDYCPSHALTAKWTEAKA